LRDGAADCGPFFVSKLDAEPGGGCFAGNVFKKVFSIGIVADTTESQWQDVNDSLHNRSDYALYLGV
jgi:hypothetical protein